MSRPRIEMHIPIAEHVSKLLGKKFSHTSVSYHAAEEREHRMPLTWDKGGFSWVYTDELERWVRGYQKRLAARGRGKTKTKGKTKRATSRR